MAESSLKRVETLWEKEKLLIITNFSFFNSVFKRHILQTCKNKGLFGKVFIKCCDLFLKYFDRVENVVGKGENGGYQHFLLFLQCFQKGR